MGAAMAPAAADTFVTAVKESGLTVDDFDVVLTATSARSAHGF